jgi:hypothetical protein
MRYPDLRFANGKTALIGRALRCTRQDLRVSGHQSAAADFQSVPELKAIILRMDTEQQKPFHECNVLISLNKLIYSAEGECGVVRACTGWLAQWPRCRWR